MFEETVKEIKNKSKKEKQCKENNLSPYLIEDKAIINLLNEEYEGNIEEQNELYKRIKKVNSYIKLLEIIKVTQYINIPRICSIGGQSTGKTSILTNIIGLDILPKGEGVVTRRPIELRLNKIKSGEPYIYFEDDINNKITDFSIIKEKITELTNLTCGNNKNIIDEPLILNIYSQTCPDLTIIDLPGISRVPVGNQPKNIEEITKEMTLKYINNPYTIIVCAIDANQDISTSDGLFLSKQTDYLGERTLGILTKVDLMDKGTNCKDILLNKIIPLKHGYIAVKNRSKLDLINNVSIKEGLNKEKSFFENDEIYNKLDRKLTGTKSLIDKIGELYIYMFYLKIDDIIYSINQHIRRVNHELSLLGKPLTNNLCERNFLIQNLIKNYCESFFNTLYHKSKNNIETEELQKNEDDNKLRNLYNNFLMEYYENDNIYNHLKINFPEDVSYLNILRPYLKDIEYDTSILFQSVIKYCLSISYEIIKEKFKRFPEIENKIIELVNNIFQKEIKNTKELLEQLLKNELEFEFTNDEEFNKKYNKENIILSNDIALFKESLKEYFKIILNNIKTIVPKTIDYKFINYLKKNLFNILSNYFNSNQTIFQDLKEAEDYIKLRADLNNTKYILEKLLKKINYSPLSSKDFISYDKNERKKQLIIVQKEKRDKLFKQSIKKLKEIRNKKDEWFRKEDIKDTLESMCIIGSIIEEKIIEEKKENPEKFIPIEEAIEQDNKQDSIFCFGLLAKNLEDHGIMTVIQKEEDKTEEEKELSTCTLDFICNGMINKKKYDLHFDFGEERNEQLLLNEYEQNKFKESLKDIISQKYGICKEKLILADPKRGSFQISLFQTDEFNSLSLEELKNDPKFGKELRGLKEIQQSLIVNACKLSKSLLDAKGNRNSGWGVGEKRGGYPYRPPIGWIGFGLNVRGKYDNGSDEWLNYDGNKNEWAVAYHGVGVGGKAKTVADSIRLIIKGDGAKNNDEKIFLLPGRRQQHEFCNNANVKNSGDPKVGVGVYCSPNPKVMDSYAKSYNGYKMALMLRVKPQRIRNCNCFCEYEKGEYWVLNGKSDEMRPYRILVKKI